MMRDIKNKCELELDYAFYPWQVINGEGETWLILREKKKLETREIERVREAILEEFTWSVTCRQAEKFLYRGNIGFAVYYLEKKEEETDSVLEEAAGEESICRQFYSAGKVMGTEKIKERDAAGSIFSSIVFAEIKTPEQHSLDLNGASSCKINIPWQAWLYGGSEEMDPRVVKVHLGQVGLRTILLEVVIKLQAKADLRLARLEKSKCLLLPKEEILYTIKEGGIQEVIGCAVNRAFYSCFVDPLTGCLSLRNIKKTTVIFISEGNGGEKILTASSLSHEKTKMAGFPVPAFPPTVYRCINRKQDIIKVDSNKVLCKNEYLWTLDYEIKDANEQRREKPPHPPAAQSSCKAQVQEAIPLRKKPGEKWIKKNGKQAGKQTKTGMLLKIVK